MKNIKIYLILFVFSLAFTSCEDEYTKFDGSQTALSFEETSFELSIPQEDSTLEIPVYVTTSSNNSRTFQVMILDETTAGTSTEYSVGNIVIPANEYSGILSIDFDYSEISGADGDLKKLIVQISSTGDVSAYNDIATIEYFREIICNDLELTITSDVWASETYVTLEQADGTVLIDRFFPFSSDSATQQVFNQSFTLPDGDYVLKIGDTYGDGNTGTGGGVTLDGSYELICSIITHASGGVFTSGDPDPFPGNPNAIVEATNFSVNP